MKTGGESSVNLVRQILRVSKAEGFPKIRFDANDLVAWIKETIARNHITSLILVWDEFSEFFKNNKTRMGSFQELTELQDSTPFNFVIVTHFNLYGKRTGKCKYRHRSFQTADRDTDARVDSI